MKEHDDDLEVGGPGAPTASSDAAEIAAAITTGLERIANVLERGLQDLADVLTRDTPRRRSSGRRNEPDT